MLYETMSDVMVTHSRKFAPETKATQGNFRERERVVDSVTAT